ncbi:MAG: hypothetical protein KW806_02060, partial [Candidatus Yanofskybacteria bacterium]|nr:hypothetical protein [Candidatus Yanofskybacteria bacterium]
MEPSLNEITATEMMRSPSVLRAVASAILGYTPVDGLIDSSECGRCIREVTNSRRAQLHIRALVEAGYLIPAPKKLLLRNTQYVVTSSLEELIEPKLTVLLENILQGARSTNEFVEDFLAKPF